MSSASRLPLFKATFILRNASKGQIVCSAPSLKIAETIANDLRPGDIASWRQYSLDMTLEAIDPVEEGRDA